MNTTGSLFRLTTFGESHGRAMGGIVDGCPAGITLNLEHIQAEVDRRRPGQSDLTTPRKERDQVEFLSGIYNGKTTGSPVAFVIRNEDQRPEDYSEISRGYRPSHADFTYDARFGFRDPRGGGRSSARETVNWVIAGAIARQMLGSLGIEVRAWTRRIGATEMPQVTQLPDAASIEASAVRCPDPYTSERMENDIRHIQAEGNTLGGAIEVHATGVPAGWGAPVFDKLNARLAGGFAGINAVKAVELGSGISGTYATGKDQNDIFINEDGFIRTLTNNSGGIQGGISNGMPITAIVHFKPVATVQMPQETITSEGTPTTLPPKGRHDVCVIPRAVPIVEAVMLIHLADACLAARLSKWS